MSDQSVSVTGSPYPMRWTMRSEPARMIVAVALEVFCAQLRVKFPAVPEVMTVPKMCTDRSPRVDVWAVMLLPVPAALGPAMVVVPVRSMRMEDHRVVFPVGAVKEYLRYPADAEALA